MAELGVAVEANRTLTLLEQSGLVRGAVAPLARQFGIDKSRAWELLHEAHDEVQQALLDRGSARLRNRVNNWWKRNCGQFPEMGLALLDNWTAASKLPFHVYEQVICLTVLTGCLAKECTRKRERRKPGHVGSRMGATLSDRISPDVQDKMRQVGEKARPGWRRILNGIGNKIVSFSRKDCS